MTISIIRNVQYNFPEMRGGLKDRLDFFLQKFIRFGSRILPLVVSEVCFPNSLFWELAKASIPILFECSHPKSGGLLLKYNWNQKIRNMCNVCNLRQGSQQHISKLELGVRHCFAKDCHMIGNGCKPNHNLWHRQSLQADVLYQSHFNGSQDLKGKTDS